MAHIEMIIRYSEEEVLHAIEEKAAKEIDMPSSGSFVASWASLEAWARNREIIVTFVPEVEEFVCVLCGFKTVIEDTFTEHANEHLESPEKAETDETTS